MKDPKKKSSQDRRLDARAAPKGAASRPPRSELEAAKALFRRGDYSRSLQLFRACLKRYPDDPHVLLDAARAFGTRYQSRRCDELLAKLETLAPHDASVQFRIGETYRILGRLSKARDAFERSRQISADNPHASFELAFLYERSHQLEAADAVLTSLRKKHPQHEGVRVLLARVHRQMGDLDSSHSVHSLFSGNYGQRLS